MVFIPFVDISAKLTYSCSAMRLLATVSSSGPAKLVFKLFRADVLSAFFACFVSVMLRAVELLKGVSVGMTSSFLALT